MINLNQIRKLNSIELRIKVAEAFDPKKYPVGTGRVINNEPTWFRGGQLPGQRISYSCPDYAGNAGVSKELFQDRSTFWLHLHAIVHPECITGLNWHCVAMVARATPREVCEAYLLTVCNP